MKNFRRSRFPKLRRQRDKAFKAWYEQNQHRFSKPLIYLGQSRKTLLFTFEGLNLNISFGLSDRELSCEVKQNNEYWDWLFCFDASPFKSEQGYCCLGCDEPRRIFNDRESIWVDHFFEPLVKWFNESLIRASCLHIWGDEDDGFWGASLTQGKDDSHAKALSEIASRMEPKLEQQENQETDLKVHFEPLWTEWPLF
jgi:hypothetical protein